MVMTEDDFEDNKFLAEFTKYELLSAFWRLCEEQFGYTDVKPTLEKLMVTMFATYTARYLKREVPVSWHGFVSYKSGNIIAFMDNLMNNILYRERYDKISAMIASSLKVAVALDSYEPEELLDCDTFAVLDGFFLRWITERLMGENIGAKLNGLDIPAVCEYRSKKHFGSKFKTEYRMLADAFYLIGAAHYFCPDDLELIIKKYRTDDCLIDSHYREFYYDYDRLPEPAGYEKLRDLVENIYTNEYLAKLLPRWNAAFSSDSAAAGLPLQRNFFSRYVQSSKDK